MTSFTAAVFAAPTEPPSAPPRPTEKVRLTYEATGACPDADAFLAEVRARVGTSWEAPANELARTIEVHVTGGADRSVARIDFVDENRQPITRVVSAKTCAEVVTGIALVTALAIESRIAEAVGQSEPAPGEGQAARDRSSQGEAQLRPGGGVEPPEHEGRRETPQGNRQSEAAPARKAALGRDTPRTPPHYDFGAGILGSFGSLPNPGLGVRGFLGLGWIRGPDFRLGVDFTKEGSVATSVSGRDYLSAFMLTLARASACPVAFGTRVKFLPCAGVEVGRLHAEGVQGSGPNLSVKGGTKDVFWLAPFLGARADVSFDVFFAEAEAAVAVPVGAAHRADFGFGSDVTGARDTVYTVSPATLGLALSIGLRIE